MDTFPARLLRAIRAAVPSVVDVTVGDTTDRSTWKVLPVSLQGTAQPTIDGFNPNDPALIQADQDAELTAFLDQERIFSAIVWAIIDTYAQTSPATIPKYNAARNKIVNAYRNQPWKP